MCADGIVPVWRDRCRTGQPSAQQTGRAGAAARSERHRLHAGRGSFYCASVDAVLCRKSVTAIWQLGAGHRLAIRKSAAEITAFADRADLLLAGQRAFKPAAFSLCENLADAQAYSRTLFGLDLLPLIQIVDELGARNLRSLAQHSASGQPADYVISTVYRAKGVEWKRVRVSNDFPFGAPMEVRFPRRTRSACFTSHSHARSMCWISEMHDELVRLITRG
jgi:hypothetical protein